MDFNQMLKQQKQMATQGDLYKTDEPKFNTDERFYQISKAQDGTGSVKIRFLPSFTKDKQNLNYYVKRFVHNVKNEKLYPGATKPETHSFWGDDAICPKTKNKDSKCPICDKGWELYNEAKESGADKKETTPILQNWLSKDEIITNILVLDDKINPNNNGKVFLFKVSKTVLSILENENERVKDYVNATEEEKLAQGIPADLTYFDAWDLLKGKNITLKYKPKKMVKQASDYWGSSVLDMQFTAIVNGEDEWKLLMEKTYCLDEFTVDANIKNEEFLEEKVKFLMFENDGKKKSEAGGMVQEQPKEQEPASKGAMPDFTQTEQPIQETAKVEEPKETVANTVQETTKAHEPKEDTKASSKAVFFAKFK